MWKIFLKNPFSLWLKWFIATCWQSYKFRKNGLQIQYMARFSNCIFGNHNVLYEGAILESVCLGDFSYVGANSHLSRVSIGKFCCLAPDVVIGLGTHPSRGFVSVHPAFYSPNGQGGATFVNHSYFEEAAPVTIGNDVWIGARATVLDGVTIGDGAIVGAGAVVVGDIPPYAVVGGIPARVLRYRFTPEQIKALGRIKWWDRDEHWLRANALRLHSIESLLEVCPAKEDE